MGSEHQFRNVALAAGAAYGAYKLWKHAKGNKQFSSTTPNWSGRAITANDITKHHMKGYFESIDKKCSIKWIRCDMYQLDNCTPSSGPLIGWTELVLTGRHGGQHRVNTPTLLVREKGRWYAAPSEVAVEHYDQLVAEQQIESHYKVDIERREQEAEEEREEQREYERRQANSDRAYDASSISEKIDYINTRYTGITAGSALNAGEVLREATDIIPNSEDDQRIKDIPVLGEMYEKVERCFGSLENIQNNTRCEFSINNGVSSLNLMAARVIATKTDKADFVWFLAYDLTEAKVNEILDNMREDKNMCVYIASWHKITPKFERLLTECFSKCKNFGFIKGFPSKGFEA